MSRQNLKLSPHKSYLWRETYIIIYSALSRNNLQGNFFSSLTLFRGRLRQSRKHLLWFFALKTNNTNFPKYTEEDDILIEI